jgi:hypothetical protein
MVFFVAFSGSQSSFCFDGSSFTIRENCGVARLRPYEYLGAIAIVRHRIVIYLVTEPESSREFSSQTERPVRNGTHESTCRRRGRPRVQPRYTVG